MQDVPIEEMWEVLEEFGINRKMFERIDPDYEQIYKIYSLISKSQKKTKYESEQFNAKMLRAK